MEFRRYALALLLLGCHYPIQEAAPRVVVLQHTVVKVQVLCQREELAPHDQRHSEDDSHRQRLVRVSPGQTVDTRTKEGRQGQIGQHEAHDALPPRAQRQPMSLFAFRLSLFYASDGGNAKDEVADDPAQLQRVTEDVVAADGGEIELDDVGYGHRQDSRHEQQRHQAQDSLDAVEDEGDGHEQRQVQHRVTEGHHQIEG